VVGCVGLVRDVTRIPSRWRRGDRVFVLRGEGADLIRFVWTNAHRFSLAHDISDGGDALALREAAAWSGLDAELATPEGPGVIVALIPGEMLDWDHTVELGTV
jgi:hypothetical protein